MQILHPLRNLMHTPQQIKLFTILQALQISDQTAILAIWTNKEPGRLPACTTRAKKFKNVHMRETLPDLDFAREYFAGGRGGEDFNSDSAFAPGAFIHCGEVANADPANLFV
jgi:hypothetical protein